MTIAQVETQIGHGGGQFDKIIGREHLRSNFKAASFNIDEIEAVLDGGDRQQERNVFQFAFASGMRPSEYIALIRNAVSISEKTISIQAAFKEAKDTCRARCR